MRADVTWAVTDATWDEFLSRCPAATFFHTSGWYRAHVATLGYRVETALIRFDDGTEALLPMATRPAFRGLLRVAESGIATGYGGLVSPQPLGAAHVEAAYAAVRRKYPDMAVTGNPHASWANTPATGEVEADATQVLPIVAPDAQRAMMTDTRIKHCKRGAKAGFRLEIRTGLSAADADAFYALYAARAAEWQYDKWVRDLPFFRALCHEAGQHLALFLAYKDDELAGFRLLGLTGPVVMDLYLATAKAHEPAHVGPLLVEAPLNWCYEQGYTEFDFQPSGRLEGVKTYKASFGAKSVSHTHTRHMGWLGRSLAAVRAGLARPATGVSTERAAT